jgi:hypothetical protein
MPTQTAQARRRLLFQGPRAGPFGGLYHRRLRPRGSHAGQRHRTRWPCADSDDAGSFATLPVQATSLPLPMELAGVSLLFRLPPATASRVTATRQDEVHPSRPPERRLSFSNRPFQVLFRSS